MLAKIRLVSTIIEILALKLLAVDGASHASSIFRRNVFKDFDLTDAALLTNGTRQVATAIECAAWCSKRGCKGYSFTPRAAPVGGAEAGGNSRGTCKIGNNPFSRQTKIGSRLYALTSDTNADKTDGFTYTRIGPSAYTFAQARAQCLANKWGNLPIVYPNTVFYRMVNKSLTSAGDKAFVDIRRLGVYLERKFITGIGDVIDATNKEESGRTQFWASGQPDATSNSTGTYVLVSWAGWEDVSDTQTANVVICQSDSASYRLLPDTGMYYRFVKDALKQADAGKQCRADGGRLLIPYGPRNGIFSVLDEFAQTSLMAGFLWIGGDLDPAMKQWIFEDGTRLNYTVGYTGENSQEYKQKWYPGEPTRFSGENCLRLGHVGWADHFCTAVLPFLCEREPDP